MKRIGMKAGGRLLMAMLALSGSGIAASADSVYRWTDGRGQVNYGNLPPSGVKAELLGDRGALSVMPAPPLAQRGTAGSALPQEGPPHDAPPHEAPAASASVPASDEALRIECEERLREPCDDSGHALRPALVVVPQRPRHPPAVSPPPRPPRNADMPQPVLPLDLSGRDPRPIPAPRHEPERRGRAFPPP